MMRRIGLIAKVIAGVLCMSASIVIAVAAWNASILRIYGDSMYPVLQEGDTVLTVRCKDYRQGDMIAFYHEEKLMVKRVIGISGDWIEICEDGTVFVNNRQFRENYLKECAQGESDIDFPYQTPHGTFFVLNDRRSNSTDSRSLAVGCIREDAVIGKCIFRLWPMERLGLLR